jgi:hypothetical protein
MTTLKIKDLFANKISRRIEEVIKVDQTDEQIIHDELQEYVVTDSIRGHLIDILESYWETPKKPHEGIAIWVSGFFGSGKSSFAKYLGLALENRRVLGKGSGELLAKRIGDSKSNVLLTNIAEQIPTEAVIFDVSTDRGIRTGNQSITEIMYRLFLQKLGYARDLDLSELEITLEEAGRLDDFKQKYQNIFKKDWDKGKGLIAIAVQEASRIMHELEPDTYATADSWRESALKRADISAGDLAKRGIELMQRRCPDKTLLFVVDEVGQFVARDIQKMLDLQAVVQNLGRVGRGKMWIVVTSQEKLTELVSGLDDKRVELARLMDRFPLQVHLEPADISEVTSKRILSKNAKAEKGLRDLFKEHRGRLTDNVRLTADIQLPELSTENFIDLYPLLPYQVDLIIQVVSGLRTQGGASKHVGGANRTIIKLAQQLLIHPDVNIASASLGTLARIDQIYDLVSGNIASEVRGKIDDISEKVDHPLAQSVAKAICLLQYVRSIHRTPENIAATLHPSVDADSCLSEVKSALEVLEKARMVRLGDDGYRIPTPAEDDWERQRANLAAKPGDISRLHAEAITALWQPQPHHNLSGVKAFKAGLNLARRLLVEGEMSFHISLSDAGKELKESVEESRKRSQTEKTSIFWVGALDEAIARETAELFRSKEILSRKERGAQTRDETALVSEEKRRLRRHQDELRRLLRQSLLAGSIYFRGNDRSPDDSATDIVPTASKVLSQTLPDVFSRFHEAAARVSKNDLESLMTTENLRGLSQAFTKLNLIHEQNGSVVFSIENDPLAEIYSRIENRTSYGEVATGRYLTDEFAKEPFGWDFDVVRLFVISLLRAGKLEVTSKGDTIESALSLDAQNTFHNNNLFRQASFRPKVGLEFTNIVDAGENFKEVFGREVSELEQSAVARTIRQEIQEHKEELRSVLMKLVQHNLPGTEVLQTALDQMKSIGTGSEEQIIQTFNSSFKELKEAIKRSSELSTSLTGPHLLEISRARKTLGALWPFLETEADLDEEIRKSTNELKDLMEKESFFRDFPTIDHLARLIEDEYERRYAEAIQASNAVYKKAINDLKMTPGWDQIDSEQQDRISESMRLLATSQVNESTPIPQIRAEHDACQGRLANAVKEVLQLVDGNRIVSISATSYFSGGIDTEEQLDQALSGLKTECLELIGAGKKVLIQ